MVIQGNHENIRFGFIIRPVDTSRHLIMSSVQLEHSFLKVVVVWCCRMLIMMGESVL